MPTISYTACSVQSPWSMCNGGAVIGPDGKTMGVCGPCGGAIGLAQIIPSNLSHIIAGAAILLGIFLLIKK